MSDAAERQELLWFGGYKGAVAIETRLLHLLRDDGMTFCANPGILASATKRSIHNVAWCDVCVSEGQKVRRDV